MNFIDRLFSPLREAANAFFKHDVALRRAEGGGSVKIVLEHRLVRKAKAPPTRAELALRKEKDELALMRTQLTELLDGMPETRAAMRHLVFVEHALAKKGMKALHKLPLDVLQHALAQLEGLVTNWSPLGLANLRSKMAVAIIDREHNPEAEADAYRTAAVMDSNPAPVPVPAEDEMRSDDAALAAAYAALGNLAPHAPEVEMTGELDSPSAKAALREAARPTFRHSEAPEQIKLRELQSS